MFGWYSFFVFGCLMSLFSCVLLLWNSVRGKWQTSRERAVSAHLLNNINDTYIHCWALIRQMSDEMERKRSSTIAPYTLLVWFVYMIRFPFFFIFTQLIACRPKVLHFDVHRQMEILIYLNCEIHPWAHICLFRVRVLKVLGKKKLFFWLFNEFNEQQLIQINMRHE